MSDEHVIERRDYSMDGEAYWDAVAEAIELAADQDQMTWITEDGKRIAAIVPVEEAETILTAVSAIEATLASSPGQIAEQLRRIAGMVESS